MANRSATDLEWWQTRRFVMAMALLAMVPLLWPNIPPLVDLPGHMGRYRVQLDLHTYRWLTDWYDFHWQLIGNLGIDILVQIFAPLLGLELTVKLIVLSIPPLIVVGLLWIAREVHGRIPATALFALPLAYCFPLQFGFVNFMLSMALALPMFALWLRMGRLGKFSNARSCSCRCRALCGSATRSAGAYSACWLSRQRWFASTTVRSRRASIASIR